jgi:hypothetical protein
VLDKGDLRQFALGHESRLGVAMQDKLDILRSAFGMEWRRDTTGYKFNPSEAAIAESRQAYHAAHGGCAFEEEEAEAQGIP